ncbi:MAG: arginine deiminase family protein [Candidatus Methanomethylicaceae archaeon]
MEEYLKKYHEVNKPARPVNENYHEELERLWGRNWCAQSEVGKLRSVLVHRPGFELDGALIDDPVWYGILKKPDLKKAQEQHDAFVEILKKEGVEIHYLNAPSPAHGPYSKVNPRIWATRDPGVVINGGAIISRMALPWRKKDEVFWARRVAELGCPILYTVNGNGTFEGGNVVWIDPKHVCIGESIRTNAEGIAQVSRIMREVGGVEEVITVPIPGYLENLEWPAGGWAHLDTIFGMADVDLALVYPPGLPYFFIEKLLSYKITLIEVPPEEAAREACNIVALEPRKFIMNADCPITRKKAEREGADVIEADLSEFVKSGGAPHCATGPLIRDPGPFL